jgi:hypothetical protein
VTAVSVIGDDCSRVRSLYGTVAYSLSAVAESARRLDRVVRGGCGETNHSRWSAQEELVYYARNAKTILKQAVWIDMLEFLSALLRVALLIPAAARTAR